MTLQLEMIHEMSANGVMKRGGEEFLIVFLKYNLNFRGFETSSLTLSDETKFRIFKSKVLRKILKGIQPEDKRDNIAKA